MIFLVFVIFTQIEVNDIVGFEINHLEARKYHLFTDIDEFQAAWFYKDDDSIIVEIIYLRDGIKKDSAVSIDPETFKALDSYIRNYRHILEDERFRLSFIETFRIDWPIVSRRDIETAVRAASNRQLVNTACCMTGTYALGAYTAALLSRNIRTEIQIDTALVPCWTGDNGWGCLKTPVPVVYKYYSINPAAYIGGAALGSGIGYLANKKKYTSDQILFDAFAREIVAFDYAGFPITKQEINEANKGTNEVLLGTLGLGAGLVWFGASALLLYTPWSDMDPEERWHSWAVATPIVLISGTGLVVITRYFINKGRQFDRRATIERLKDRNIEH
jgi:hypothetical protein